MPPINREPLPEQTISTEWCGSQITIYDLDGIVQDASSDLISIYDRSDFPYPIERTQVTAEVVKSDGEDALALRSTIQLDRTHVWPRDWLTQRFQSHLAPQDKKLPNYLSRPPFFIKNVVFNNCFHIADEGTGSKLVLWLNHQDSKIVIANSIDISTDNRRLNIQPPAMHSISTASQLESLMRATALVADFVNGFQIEDSRQDDRIAGIPLSREYSVGQERRIITKSSSKKLGEKALKRAADDPEDSVWDEAHGVEKFRPSEAVTLEDIGGLKRIKAMLRDVATSFKHPEVMTKWGAKRPQGVLFYGESGTGKTMLAQALANEIGAEMWVVQGTDIYAGLLGNSEKHIKEIFDKLRMATTPTILFFDEFESIVGITNQPSSGGADNARNAVAGIFKQEMNTIAAENPNVLIVAATNNLDAIHPSLIRSGRFDHKVYVPMPDQESRKDIVINIVSKSMLGGEEGTFRIFDSDLNADELAIQADGFSGADIAEVFRRLMLSRAMEEARSGRECPPIAQAEIVQEIQNFQQNG